MTMGITLDDVVTWLIVGAVAGSIAGTLVTWSKAGFGRLLNLVVGLVGALIGGLLFKLLRVDLGAIGQISITLREVVAGIVGSLIFLGVVWIVRKRRASKKAAEQPGGTGAK
jgi:uncharacterized membrane protein YeaQ/YmgE (transglycosylase-associated protein family)